MLFHRSPGKGLEGGRWGWQVPSGLGLEGEGTGAFEGSGPKDTEWLTICKYSLASASPGSASMVSPKGEWIIFERRSRCC